jgi:integrase/recombinase XerD
MAESQLGIVDRYISWKSSYAQRAAECYRIWIVRFYDFVAKKPEEWEAEDFVRFSLNLQSSHSVKTVQFALTAVKDHCRWLRNMKLADPPLEMIKKPKGKAKSYRPITRDQFESIVSNIDTSTDYGVRDALLYWTFWDAGMRVSELCSMDVDQLDLFDKSAVIGTKKGHGEVQKQRKVFWGKRTHELLLKYLEIRKKYARDGALFVNMGPYSRGERMETVAVQKVIKKHGRAVGIEVRPHQIRHSWAVDRYRRGADLKFIQWSLGHESLRTTETYLQVEDREMEAKARIYV